MKIYRLQVLLAFVGLLITFPAAGGDGASTHHTIRLVDGHLYGPGPLPDQGLPEGELSRLDLASGDGLLEGRIAMANNGGEEPNVPGERLQGGTVDGRLCDGTLINENVDVGYVELMNGNLKLLLAAVAGGSHGGTVHFYLDEGANWTILDDIGIDPGFETGVVKIDDFTWSTGPRPLPLSKQTRAGYPGGVDQAGSKPSGDYIPGRLGDDDFDGRLDGVFNAIGSFPLEAAFLPGAPFAQTRRFTSDVPVDALTAAALTLANARNHLALADDMAAAGGPEASVAELRADSRHRLALARRHLERAVEAASGGTAPRLSAMEERLATLAAMEEPATDDVSLLSTDLFAALAERLAV